MNPGTIKTGSYAVKFLGIEGLFLAGIFAPQAVVHAIAQAWYRSSGGKTLGNQF